MGGIFEQLCRDPSTETGFSLVSGAPLKVQELAEHRIELHVFDSSDAAGAFVAGLTLAGNKNSLAWTWQPGTRDSNRAVIVAQFDQACPAGNSLAEIIRVIEHDAAQHDRDERQASLRKIEERDTAWREQVDIRTLPLRQALKAAGFNAAHYGHDWVRVGHETISIENGLYKIRCGDRHEGQDDEVRHRYAEAAEASGVTYDPEEGDFCAGPFPTPEEAAASVPKLRDAVTRATAMRKAAWHEAFVASMKITAARRRFLMSAATGGISTWYHRGQIRARAGHETIGPSEYHRLLKVGWIKEESRLSAIVTENGLKALAASGRKRLEEGPRSSDVAPAT